MLPLRLLLANYIAERWYLVDQELLRTIGLFVGPALAAVIVMVGWRRTHRDALERDARTQQTAADRDLENWRRTTVVDTVISLLQLSQLRLDSVREYGEDRSKWIDSTRKLEHLYLILVLAVPDTLLRYHADLLLEPHRKSLQEFLAPPKPNDSFINVRRDAIAYMKGIDHDLLQRNLRNEVMFFLGSKTQEELETDNG
ncbi:hypothetical protein [Rhodococcoides fascians]|uniref:hypothetical protein n=1 Tax=Rhodococcoides fascians TaxID=1828 RepID=UPI001427D127